ncbi:Uncharacterised protein [Burkholderia pseudomallei]|nr:Uncharacterised protein [Burkholderia pseudomallei]CAJ3498784.1 Uncharacterised protein [Burkholderia pseudomallei]CAJ4208206.1 Uncharacterised protein [Burkholderia pseudomallei]CAJ5511686.1 Uncharacterised protein [Burkholderia pseudomallei]CAJ5683598.1 Uncharacterised protein [Burkholderia pseudomallei]
MTAACPDALRENSQSQIISARVAYLLPFAVRPQSHDAQACSSSASQQILTGGPIRQPTAHHVRSRQRHPPFSRSLIHDSMNAGEAAEFTQSIVIMSRADHGPSIKFTFLPFSHYVSLTWSRIRMKLIQIRFIERLLFVLSNTPPDIELVYFDHSTRSIRTVSGRAKFDSIRQTSIRKQSLLPTTPSRPELIESIFRGLSNATFTKSCFPYARFFSPIRG